MLKRNVNDGLMHGDMVPTFLGAAGIRYSDSRKDVVNLLQTEVPSRTRIVQSSLGKTTDWETLVQEAR
jgi:hypothetical protein